MKALQDCLLYGFVDTAYLRGRAADTVACMLCDSGADIIQLRAKDLGAEQIRGIAESMLEITQSAGVHLVINDHPSIAAQVGAAFCHLGQEDFYDQGYTHICQITDRLDLAKPRQGALGIGLSTHSPDQARKAQAAGAHYIAVGPVFPTGTKPNAAPVTVEYVRWAAQRDHVACPWFAIGGITLDNLDSVLEAGAERVCVVSAILAAPDPARACQAFKERLVSARAKQINANSHRS